MVIRSMELGYVVEGFRDASVKRFLRVFYSTFFNPNALFLFSNRIETANPTFESGYLVLF